MKTIDGFKDVEGLEVIIVPHNILAVRRMTKQEDRKEETIIEIMGVGGAVINIVEPKDRNFKAFLQESLE